jgi:predicted nucleotide-binding protein (sugar kinase/HSP70/actin superfamily)
LARWFDRKHSVEPASRRSLQIGIPKLLNLWSTHQFWSGFFAALGLDATALTFSSDTSEEQGRQFGKGRGTVDCCYPVKCGAGHYGELLFGLKRPITILFSPMIASLPSFLRGHVVENLACPRVMAAPENIKAGFLREQDLFAAQGVRYVSPLVTLAEPRLVPKQLFGALQGIVPGLTLVETARAVDRGYAALKVFDATARARSRQILTGCAHRASPCLLVLARPYHMDPGLGHEIDGDLQAFGYPILWSQYLPTDADLMDWMFGEEVRTGVIRSPLDISDVWPSSYSANTNEILWGAKFAARMPWIACVVRLASYECGMDQPTYTPVQQIVERSGTLFFSFQELDSTKPAGSVKIRVETITHYLERSAADIIARKHRGMPSGCPLLGPSPGPGCPSGASTSSGV